jgi:hypothetical protein
MITNFKLFEDNWNKMYNVKPQKWVISLNMPDFIISLKKIGVTDINKWINLYHNKVFTDYGEYPDRETITIRKERYKSDDNIEEDSFTWYWYPASKSDEYTDFMGKIECTPEEIKNYYDEIEINKNINKYNL